MKIMPGFKIRMIGFKVGCPRPTFSKTLDMTISKYEKTFLKLMFMDWDFISIRKIWELGHEKQIERMEKRARS